MSEQHPSAIIQRDNETYAIVTHTPMGLVTADYLEQIAAVTRKYQIPILKITSAQRLALVGIKEKDIETVVADLNLKIGNALGLCYHFIQACPGNSVCRLGVNDSLELAAELDRHFEGKPFPAKVKMGISGCPLCCGESMVRDFGAFAKRDKGWTVVFGGNAGLRHRTGDIIAENLSKEDVLLLAEKCLDFYRKHAKNRERTARFVERIGIEEFKKHVL